MQRPFHRRLFGITCAHSRVGAAPRLLSNLGSGQANRDDLAKVRHGV